MNKLLTLFNVIAGSCSILGLIVQLESEATYLRDEVAYPLFGLALVVSLYILLVPANPLERNVGMKTGLYERRFDPDQPERVLIQRGEIQVPPIGSKAVEFGIPFKSPPEVEIVGARVGGAWAEVDLVTSHQVVLKGAGGTGFGRKVVWIA